MKRKIRKGTPAPARRACALQEWVKFSGQRVIVVFEGRDAAGKGGCIRAMTERVSPRMFRVVALPALGSREDADLHAALHQSFSRRGRGRDLRSQLVQPCRRRAGDGLLHEEDTRRFLPRRPAFEQSMIVDTASFCSSTGSRSARTCSASASRSRINDPVKQWKLSPIDLPSRERWYDYSRARDEMFDATDRDHARWHIVKSDDKRRARLNLISHFLEHVPYAAQEQPPVTLPDRDMRNAYDDDAAMHHRGWVPERY
jgi:polyphosphate kinase 2 (PPK2 family)